MKIALLRHARVLYDEPLFSTSASFLQARADYDDAPLELPQIRLSSEEFPRCYVSTMDRARHTAEMVYPGPVRPWPELVEVEYTPFFFQWIPFPTQLRKIASRIGWYFNWKKIAEKRRDTMQRARHVVLELLQGRTGDALLVTHGFFMRCLQHELHKLGFRGSIGLSPQHGHVYVFEEARTVRQAQGPKTQS